MTTSFTVNKADLEFILKQIKIAEATSLGYTPAIAPVSTVQTIQDAYGLSAADAAIAPFGLRTVDGRDNKNLPGKGGLGAADNDPALRQVVETASRKNRDLTALKTTRVLPFAAVRQEASALNALNACHQMAGANSQSSNPRRTSW